MQSITISDQAFEHANRAAAAVGLSLPDYLETLIIHDVEGIDNEGLTLSPEQLAKVRLGQEDVRAGRVFTPAQVREQMQRKHEAWIQSHPN